ncbi:hypothetical protein BpHYR1_042496 [Brachionus plicatilis]|uniref:Uncharacterized protein n=1 Tax=Brachionus plicatilis TaxID=10195 RepID=A0A3M7SXD9_BRAPC|nr:hypothetical protein BpHYR1_042496 [Brachionus plicatilis]
MYSESKQKRTSDSGMKRKSIRLQIDLPIQDSDSDFEETLGATPANKIHLKISIDKSSSKKSLNFAGSSTKRQKKILDKSTSGYSSSGTGSLTNSLHEYSYLSEIEHNGTLDENCFAADISGLKRKRDFDSTENVYDRLVHSCGKIRTQRSMKIQKKNESILSVYECVSENSCDPDDNIYEEISNFVEQIPKIKSPKSHVYENSKFGENNYYNEDFLPEKQIKRSFKREYTVNEIFDNLKNFKKQAKEQELLTNKNSKMYENNQVSKPIYV